MRIVVVEDNAALAKGIAYQLSDEGHAVDLFADGAEAAAHLDRDRPAAVVLDITLPGMDGLSVLRRLRRAGNGVPVLLLTARSDTEDRVAGLDAGADDYLVKPFDMAELAARVRALLRRGGRDANPVIAIGAVSFDTTSRDILHDGRRLSVPRRETAVFEALIGANGRLVSKDRLMEHVYGSGADVGDGAIEAHVSRLRKRLAGLGVEIRTVRGLGYLIEDRP